MFFLFRKAFLQILRKYIHPLLSGHEGCCWSSSVLYLPPGSSCRICGFAVLSHLWFLVLQVFRFRFPDTSSCRLGSGLHQEEVPYQQSVLFYFPLKDLLIWNDPLYQSQNRSSCSRNRSEKYQMDISKLLDGWKSQSPFRIQNQCIQVRNKSGRGRKHVFQTVWESPPNTFSALNRDAPLLHKWDLTSYQKYQTGNVLQSA